MDRSSTAPVVVTLTLNPALDLSTTVDAIEPWRKLRCHDPRLDPGGGGVNVARVVHELGGRVVAVVALGSHTGSLVASALVRQGIMLRRVPVRNTTRQNFAVTEASTGRQYRFVQQGERMSAAEWKRCLRTTVEEARAARCVVASGSLPEGVPHDFYAQLAEHLEPLRVPLIVDTSGPALVEAAFAPVELVKPSVNELQSLAHRPLSGVAEYEAAAREVLARGRCRAILVSLGAEGALLVPRHEPSTLVRAPSVVVVSSIGAGDSMVGGIALTLARNGTLLDAVRLGVAAGTAAVLNPGTGLCRAEDLHRLMAQVETVETVETIDPAALAGAPSVS